MSGAGVTNARLDAIARALEGLREHPQDHGWRRLYETITHLLGQGSPSLLRVLDTFSAERPNASAVHLITLLGISVRMVADRELGNSRTLLGTEDPRDRVHALEDLIIDYEVPITRTVLLRQNSFTNIRRFLVPQVLIARYFSRLGAERPNFMDLGTGLGILPRQLNNPFVFERFTSDLAWPFGIPSYQEAPLGRRFGLDRAPLPDLEWVQRCYGPSDYYDDLFQDLLWVFETVRGGQDDVLMLEMDILDLDRLSAFIRENRIQVVNCSFVLYQYEQAIRAQIIASVVDNLTRPGLMISMEPNADLTRPGCHVRLFRHGDANPVNFAFVTDSHFVGEVKPAEDYWQFSADYL